MNQIPSSSFIPARVLLEPSSLNLNIIPERTNYYSKRREGSFYGNQWVVDLRSGQLKKQKFFVKDKKEFNELLNQTFIPLEERYIGGPIISGESVKKENEFSMFQLLESVCDVTKDITFGNSFFEMSDSFQRLFTQSRLLYKKILSNRKHVTSGDEGIRPLINQKKSKQHAQKSTMRFLQHLKTIASNRIRIRKIIYRLKLMKRRIEHEQQLTDVSAFQNLYEHISDMRQSVHFRISCSQLAQYLLRRDVSSSTPRFDSQTSDKQQPEIHNTLSRLFRELQREVESIVGLHDNHCHTNNSILSQPHRQYIHNQNTKLLFEMIQHQLTS